MRHLFLSTQNLLGFFPATGVTFSNVNSVWFLTQSKRLSECTLVHRPCFRYTGLFILYGPNEFLPSTVDQWVVHSRRFLASRESSRVNLH